MLKKCINYAYFHSLMTSIKELCQVSGQVRQDPEHFVIVWDEVIFQCSLPVTEWFTANSRMGFLNPRNSFPHGGGNWFMTHSHMIRCTYWMQWMLDVWTYQKIIRDDSGMQKDSFPGVLKERVYGVMWMKTCGQMQKTELTGPVVFLYLYLSYTSMHSKYV